MNKDEGDQEAEPQGEIEELDKIVEKILKKFLIGSESPFLEDINLILLMKALPSKIVDYNLKQMELFNFAILQNSLIAF